jgi:uncharacterized protein (DUF433 family)
VEALTKQNGVRLLGKLKKKVKKKEVKTDLPYLSFYKKKPETHIFFFLAQYDINLEQVVDFLNFYAQVQFLPDGL